MNWYEWIIIVLSALIFISIIIYLFIFGMESMFPHAFDKKINKITNTLKYGKNYHSQDKPENGGMFIHNVITNSQETNTNDDESNKSTSPKILIAHTTSNKGVLVSHIIGDSKVDSNQKRT